MRAGFSAVRRNETQTEPSGSTPSALHSKCRLLPSAPIPMCPSGRPVAERSTGLVGRIQGIWTTGSAAPAFGARLLERAYVVLPGTVETHVKAGGGNAVG